MGLVKRDLDGNVARSSLLVPFERNDGGGQFRGGWPRRIREWIPALNAVRARGHARLNPAVKFTGLPGHRAAHPFDRTRNWLAIETPSGIPLYVLCIREYRVGTAYRTRCILGIRFKSPILNVTVGVPRTLISKHPLKSILKFIFYVTGVYRRATWSYKSNCKSAFNVTRL